MTESGRLYSKLKVERILIPKAYMLLLPTGVFISHRPHTVEQGSGGDEDHRLLEAYQKDEC